MERNVNWNVGVTCLAELAREARCTLALEASDAVDARSPVQALYASTIINFYQHGEHSNRLTTALNMNRYNLLCDAKRRR